MKPKPLEIISGGQTGVDRAALDAALALDFPCGGWCPTGRFAEDGIIPDRYPLKELKKGGYKLRTIQNLEDADGTLIFYFTDLDGGTEETVYRCIKLRRRYKLIDGDEVLISRAIELSLGFVRTHALRRLNVAGPRASKTPRAHQYAFEVVAGLLRQLESADGEPASANA